MFRYGNKENLKLFYQEQYEEQIERERSRYKNKG